MGRVQGLERSFENGWLIGIRFAIAMLLLVIVGHAYFRPIQPWQWHALLAVAGTYIVLWGVQWFWLRPRKVNLSRIGLLWLADLFLLACLVYATGGAASPYSFLFALCIVAAGAESTAMELVALSLAASAMYLCSVYAYALKAGLPIGPYSTFASLMNTSILFLIGGVVAMLAKRRERMVKEQDRLASQHRALQLVHNQVMQAMQEAVLLLNEDYKIMAFNPSAKRMFRALEIGQDVRTLLPIPHRLLDVMESQKSFSTQECKHNGRSYLLSATRFREKGGNSMWLFTVADITDFTRLKEKLVEQERLAALGRMAAMLAHEIRNPLQTISQAMELLPKASGDESAEIQRIVWEESQRLNRLLNNILGFSCPLRPRPMWASMKDVLRQTIRLLEHEFGQRIRLRCRCNALYLDVDHFRVVLDNLLRNALEANGEEGSVSLTLSTTDTGSWRLIVQDQGGGVPEAFREKLFEPFTSFGKKGAGLGLAVVRQICNANGWRVHFQNVEGGARFVVEGEGMGGID